MDDWLRRERFVFLGWSGLMLFPTAYLALGGFYPSWAASTRRVHDPLDSSLVTSRFTHGLASSPWQLQLQCVEVVEVKLPIRYIQRGTLPAGSFLAFHGTLGLVGFMLRQFSSRLLVAYGFVLTTP